MNAMDNQSEIPKLRQIKWKTNLSRRISEFAEIIKDDEVFEKYFGEKYIEELIIKSKEISHTIIKLGIAYAILMLSLFASQNTNESEFEIFGYGFKNLANYKEFLLFMAATISPISAVLSAHKKYITALAKECVAKIAPDNSVRQFYSHKYLDDYFDGFASRKYGETTHRHGFSVFLLMMFIATMLFLFLTLIAASFFIQISVIYDVVMRPASSHFLNSFVVAFSIASILFSWIVTILQFPMPEVDLSNYSKLSELEKTDPEKYNEMMQRLSNESARKEAISIIILSVIVYISTFSVISIYWFPSGLNDLAYFLGKAMPGAFFVMLITSEVIWHSKKRSMSWLFKTYPDASKDRLKVYMWLNRIIFLAKILVPLFLTTLYAIYVFSGT